MSGLLLLYVLGPHTTLGRLFDGKLTETRLAIVLAQTFVAAPFLVIAARASFAAVDPALEDVAASLGHGRLARFWRVAVPAALPGIGAGLLLAWLRSFGEFGATVILAYHPYSLPVYTFVEFDATGLPATVLPIAVALGAALTVLLLERLAQTVAPSRTACAARTGRAGRQRAGRCPPRRARLCAEQAPRQLLTRHRPPLRQPAPGAARAVGCRQDAHAAPARRADAARRRRAHAGRARIERAARSTTPSGASSATSPSNPH